MKRQSVDSSNINSIGYNKDKEILEVEFKTGSIYHYKNINSSLYNGLVDSSSIGKFFNLEIRKRDYVKGEYKDVDTLPNFYICGKAGAGKTFVAKYLIKKLGYIQAKFAFPVYAIAYDYFDMEDKDRELLQTIGTECAREAVGADIWVNRFVEDIRIVKLTRQKLGLPVAGLVCDDCRFKNEEITLSKNGWIGLFLDVSDEIRIQRLCKRDGDAQISTLQHSSELGVDEFKDKLIQVDASGTLEETYTQLDNIILGLKNGTVSMPRV